MQDTTQIHKHMCYSAFNDILPEIAAMDADVATIKPTRSGMELLRGFGSFQYPNEIGPASATSTRRVPGVEEMARPLRNAAEVVPARSLWLNPDCRLKTCNWPETEAALRHRVQASQALRSALASA